MVLAFEHHATRYRLWLIRYFVGVVPWCNLDADGTILFVEDGGVNSEVAEYLLHFSFHSLLAASSSSLNILHV